MSFDTAFDRLIGHEGGYADDPADPGGETMWGVTAKVARVHGYDGPMKDLPRETAKAIYEALYWKAAQCDKMPYAIAFQVFDAAVNHGVSQAAKFLQRALGIADDGAIGPQTMMKLALVPTCSLVLRFNAEREEFYTGLKTWPNFGKGWSRRVAGNLRYAAQDI